MTTYLQTPAPTINSPIKFLGASVMSFNARGNGAGEEGALQIELIKDCDAGDYFAPELGLAPVGTPLWFDTTPYGGLFQFGGILQNWNKTQSASGLTYSVNLVDPRQCLQNLSIIVDSTLTTPIFGPNFFNAYAAYEQQVTMSNCGVFGTAQSDDRGMPYGYVLSALASYAVDAFTSAGYYSNVNWASFPTAPTYFRLTGPQTALGMLEQACEVLGYTYNIYLDGTNTIQVQLIPLHNPPPSFSSILDNFDGLATEISYGQELRNDVTKAVIIGEKQHYLTQGNYCYHYFGDDQDDSGNSYPIIPYAIDTGTNTFWISKRVATLNAGLRSPLPTNGPYTINELDIRAAMASYEQWCSRAFDSTVPGSFNAAVRQTFGSDVTRDLINKVLNLTADNEKKHAVDVAIIPDAALVNRNAEEIIDQLQIIHQFVQNLGTTYYGKSFAVLINELVCWHWDAQAWNAKVFSSVPTNEGGWVEGNVSILGLSDPHLGQFRTDDGRIKAFGVFNISGTNPDIPSAPVYGPQEGGDEFKP